MNTLKQIFLKDARRYRWAWISMLVIAAIHVFLYGTGYGLGEGTGVMFLTVASSMMAGLLLFFVMVMVVQEETLGDPDAYWLTRPMQRVQVLGAKVAFYMVFFGLSWVVAQSIVMLLNDGASRIPYVFAELFDLSWLPVFALIAAQTRSLARFLLVIVGLMVASWLLMFFSFAVIEIDLDFPAVLPANTPEHIVAWVQAVLWILGGGGVLVYFYRFKRAKQAWAMMAGVILLSLFFYSDTSRVIGSGEDVSVELADKTLNNSGSSFYDGKNMYEYEGDFIISEVPEGVDVWAQVDWVELKRKLEGDEVGKDELELENYQFYKKVDLSPAEDGKHRFTLELFNIEEGELEKLKGDAKIYISIDIIYSTQREVARVPFHEGVNVPVNGSRVGIANYSLSSADDSGTKELRINYKAYMLDGTFEPSVLNADYYPLEGLFSFALYDTERDLIISLPLETSYGSMEMLQSAGSELDIPEDINLDACEWIVYAREIVKTGDASIGSQTVTLER